jgi:hypothetical protein
LNHASRAPAPEARKASGFAVGLAHAASRIFALTALQCDKMCQNATKWLRSENGNSLKTDEIMTSIPGLEKSHKISIRGDRKESTYEEKKTSFRAHLSQLAALLKAVPFQMCR